MTAQQPVEVVEGVGSVYGSRLRRNGIGTLAELRRAPIADIAAVAGGGRRRARSWKGQAWLMAAGMPRHAAEVIVLSGVACTLQELISADPDDIVDVVRRAQEDPESQRNRIPDNERIDVDRSLAEYWQQMALIAVDFEPRALPPTAVTTQRPSISSAINRAVDTALGDIPSIAEEERITIRDQIADVCRDRVFEPPADEDEAHVQRLFADGPRILGDEVLRHLGLWPAGDWLRRLAWRETTKVTHFAPMEPERVRRDLFRGISPGRVYGLVAESLNRAIGVQGAEALFAIAEALSRSLLDPGLPALGGMDGGIAGLDGTGVRLGLVGQGWDRAHPAFAAAKLTLEGVSVPESPWSSLDTAVLSQIVAVPMPAQEAVARPELGPKGIAPAASVTLFAAEPTASALASAIDRASSTLGAGSVLLVPRTCLGLVRGPNVRALVDLPLPANPATHAALLRAVDAGVTVVVPAGIGRGDLGNLPMDHLLVAPERSPPVGLSSIVGPAAEPGVAERLQECASSGVLVVGTLSAWSNHGAGVIRVPDLYFTVAGGSERVVAGAGFTAGWHGPHAAAATASGLAVLVLQATTVHGDGEAIGRIRNLLEQYTPPSWASGVPTHLITRGHRHAASMCALGIATGDTIPSGKAAAHDSSAACLLKKIRGE